MTLPKGWGPGGPKGGAGGKSEERCTTCEKLNNSLEKLGKHIAEDSSHYKPRLHLGKRMILFSIIMALYLLVFLSLGNYFLTFGICLIVVIVGFLFCWVSYRFRRRNLKTEVVKNKSGFNEDSVFGFAITAFPFLIGSDSKAHEHKTRVFYLIFGFIASLAITNALLTYYNQYIKGLTLLLPTLIGIASENPLPGIRLV